MIHNYNVLPRVRDSISYLYLEHAIIEKKNFSIVATKEGQSIQIPIAQITCLMLGPGTSITQQAIKVICENGCTIVWCGEHGEKFYASGMSETRNSRNILCQANMFCNEELRTSIVRKMYEMRFPKLPQGNYTIEQLRGMEGIRMKESYKRVAKTNNVEWHGRKYKGDWDSLDPVNKAISQGNSILYNIVQAVIVSLGYSPAIGFVHKGDLLAFVYDIADLYKAETTIPAAFEAIKENSTDLNKCVRLKCRKYFEEAQILKRIPKDLEYLFYGV